MKTIRTCNTRLWSSVLAAAGAGAAVLYGCSSAPSDDCATHSNCAESDAASSDAGGHVDAIVSSDSGVVGDAPHTEAGCPASTPDECGSTCTNTQTDPQNCGVCGKVCPGSENDAGAATCTSGSCTVGCSGTTPTNCSGGCVNLMSDPNHCGTCSTACSGPTTSGTGAAACTAGADGGPACSLACIGSTSQACGSDCVDPTQPAHCGSTCLACPDPTTGAASGSAACTLGDAGVGTCSVTCSTADSRQCPAAGGAVACYAPNDLNNCGKCGNACVSPPSTQGQAVCQGSPLNCGVTCNGGYHQCVTATAPDGDCLSNSDVPSLTSDPCIFSVPGAVFVSSTGSNSAAGTAAAPFATVTYALAHLGSTARVYVCNGSYSEQVAITAAVSIFGGLSCTAGTWSYVGSQATVTGPAGGPALSIAAGAGAVDIEDMAFVAPGATGAGGSSIGAFANGSSNVALKRSNVQAGAAQPGQAATAVGAAAAAPPGSPGNPPTAGPPKEGGTGGAGGTNGSCASVGGLGGSASAVSGVPNGGDGTPGSSNGEVVTTCDTTGNPASGGQPGSPGATGPGAADWASFTSAGWNTLGGAAGQPGTVGQGGGGGAAFGVGPTQGGGGAGGAGGCGGSGGAPGTGGGSSIAILTYNSVITLTSCVLTAGTAGGGGGGAAGQPGQPGGGGGSGTSGGCGGGQGANGGNGGAGGGGAGGVSVGVLWT
ncbi:MAG: hypothetical protein ACRELB_16455, partial [Polyangiaceae bacterium]